MKMKLDLKEIVGCLMITVLLFSFFWILVEKEELEEDNKVVETKCFQRVLGHDKIFDIETKTIMHGSFYNTTWYETECGKYDDYVLSQNSEVKS